MGKRAGLATDNRLYPRRPACPTAAASPPKGAHTSSKKKSRDRHGEKILMGRESLAEGFETFSEKRADAEGPKITRHLPDSPVGAKMGARNSRRKTTSTLRVAGAFPKKLHGATHSVIPDRIEGPEKTFPDSRGPLQRAKTYYTRDLHSPATWGAGAGQSWRPDGRRRNKRLDFQSTLRVPGREKKLCGLRYNHRRISRFATAMAGRITHGSGHAGRSTSGNHKRRKKLFSKK